MWLRCVPHAATAGRHRVLEHGDGLGRSDSGERRGRGAAQLRISTRRPPFAAVERLFQWLNAFGIPHGAERLDRTDVNRRERAAVIYVADDVGKQWTCSFVPEHTLRLYGLVLDPRSP